MRSFFQVALAMIAAMVVIGTPRVRADSTLGQPAPRSGYPGTERQHIRFGESARQSSHRKLLGHLVPAMPEGNAGFGRVLSPLSCPGARDDRPECRPFA